MLYPKRLGPCGCNFGIIPLELQGGINTIPNTLGAKPDIVQFWQGSLTSAGGLDMTVTDSNIIVYYPDGIGDASYDLKAVAFDGICDSQNDLLVNIYSPEMTFDHGLTGTPDIVLFFIDNGDGSETFVAQGLGAMVDATSITVTSSQAFSSLRIKLLCFNNECGKSDTEPTSIVPGANTVSHSLGAVPYMVQIWQENIAGVFTLFNPGGLPLDVDATNIEFFNGDGETYDNIYFKILGA